jgi:hypothetical protein
MNRRIVPAGNFLSTLALGALSFSAAARADDSSEIRTPPASASTTGASAWPWANSVTAH